MDDQRVIDALNVEVRAVGREVQWRDDDNGVNRVPGDSFVEQTERADAFEDEYFRRKERTHTVQDKVSDNERKYNEWKDFTDGLVWFDTAGCQKDVSNINDSLWVAAERKECYKQATPI